MSRVLIIESSALQQDSVSRQLTRDFIQQWQAAHPSDEISVRDLAVTPVPHGRGPARWLDEATGAALADRASGSGSLQ